MAGYAPVTLLLGWRNFVTTAGILMCYNILCVRGIRPWKTEGFIVIAIYLITRLFHARTLKIHILKDIYSFILPTHYFIIFVLFQINLFSISILICSFRPDDGAIGSESAWK